MGDGMLGGDGGGGLLLVTEPDVVVACFSEAGGSWDAISDCSLLACTEWQVFLCNLKLESSRMGGLCLKVWASSHEVSFKLTNYNSFWTNATAHQQMNILEWKRGHWTSLDRRI